VVVDAVQFLEAKAEREPVPHEPQAPPTTEVDFSGPMPAEPDDLPF